MKKKLILTLLFLITTFVSAQAVKKDIVNKKQVITNSANGIQSTTATTYDFTTGSNKFYGGTAGATEVESGVWGMIAGDTDASGVVDASDRSNAWNERNLTGYKDSDVNLSGVTDASDRSTTWNNRNKSTSVPN